MGIDNHYFKNTLTNAYNNLSPQEFFDNYKNFVNSLSENNLHGRCFIEGTHEEILKTIKQIYNDTKYEIGIDNTKNLYYMFGLTFWLYIWH